MDPIVLTCGRFRQTFDVPPDRVGETCHCPYCGDLHYVPNPGMRRLGQNNGVASPPKPKYFHLCSAADVSRFKYALAGSCGVFIGMLAGSGLTELSYDRSASVLVLEKLLHIANAEKQRAIEACDRAKSQLAASRNKRQLIERERDDAQRRIRELNAGLDDAMKRLGRLRQ